MVSSFMYNNSGRGGHYYSVVQFALAAARRQGQTVIVVNVGDFPAPALEVLRGKPGVELINVIAARYADLTRSRMLYSLLDEIKPLVIHSFDGHATAAVLGYVQARGVPFFITKCGGPRFKIPRGPSPDFVFSPKDVEHYAKRRGGRIVKPVLLPGRVRLARDLSKKDIVPSPFELRAERSGIARIVRIARFHKAYENSFLQTIRLGTRLRECGVEAHVALIGYPNDRSVVAKIKAAASDADKVFTSDQWTIGASRYLEHADVVVGTGRGVMEAAAAEKIVLIAGAGSDLPTLLDRDTVMGLLDENFSPRSRVDSPCTVASVKRLIQDPALRADYDARIRLICNELFDVERTCDAYFEHYHEAIGRTGENRSSLRLIWTKGVSLLARVSREIVARCWACRQRAR